MQGFAPRANDYVAVQHGNCVFFGVVNLVDDDGWYVEVAPGVFYRVERKCVVLLPAHCVSTCKGAVAAGQQVRDILSLVGASPAIVTAAAVPGAAGGAATMSGLATLGGAGGALGGIVLVAAAPAVLGTAALSALSNVVGNDTVTHRAAVGSAAAGAAVGTTAVIIAVSEAGAVVGVSGAGLTSGLAALGGGSLAVGGGGMAAGLAVVAAVPVAAAGLIALTVFGTRQGMMLRQYRTRMRQWEHRGMSMPAFWTNR